MVNKNLNSLALILILGVAFYLRVAGITWGLPTKNLALTSYHPDEPAVFFSFEEIKRNGTVFPPPESFFYWGPFYFYMVGLAIGAAKFFGLVTFGSRDFFISHLAEADKLYIIARLVTAITGIATVYLLYLIGKNLYNKKMGLLAASLMAILPGNVIGSHYAKADVPVCLWITLTLYFSVMILIRGDLKFYIFSGLFLAIAVTTKLNGGVAVFAILTAHILGNIQKKFHRSMISKKIILTFIVFLISFLLLDPFALFYFSNFKHWFFTIVLPAKEPVLWNIGWTKPLWLRYITLILFSSVGKTVFLFFIIGLLICFLNFKKNKIDAFLLISTTIIYLIISLPKMQMVMYSLPLAPFIVIVSVRIFEYLKFHAKYKTILSSVLFFTLFAYTFLYTASYVNLMKTKNVREEASEWIERNIPKTAIIGIAKNYYWTPSIIRQYNPPYNVISGGDVQSQLAESVRGLKKVAQIAGYIVISDFEYRDFLRLPNRFPEENKVLTDIMFKKYREIARFEKSPEAFGITFKKRWPQWDLMYLNPTIIVLKKNKNNI